MRVIGTAGHVDHGKSTLVAALTGIHPDRLKEEQEREMTIDLGFAWMPLEGGEIAGIVDVPGHRDFIENMLAGIGGIDAVLFVVAADEGVMPQTKEHLAILDLLQIPAGVVALTKIDMVDDPEWLDLVEIDVRQALVGTVLESASLVRVSAKTGEGLGELKQSLSSILAQRPARPDLGRARLAVDRVFTVAGFGTVVTGTLLDGKFSLGEDVDILPMGIRGRVRGLQSHNSKVEVAVPGSRTAINISGVELGLVRRGDVVARPGRYKPVQRLDVFFRHLSDASIPLRHDDEVKFFLGATEVVGRVRLLGSDELPPGEEGWLQIELRQPVVAARGDRYILRRPSPGETIGGGEVVDPYPARRHKRFSDVIERLQTLRQGSPADVLFQTALTLGAVTARELAGRARLLSEDAVRAFSELLESEQLIQLEEGLLSPQSDLLVMSAPLWETETQRAVREVERYHRSYPLRRGISREELKSRLKMVPRLFNALLRRWLLVQKFVEKGAFISLPDHVVMFNHQQQELVNKLMAQFALSPYSPPSIKECQIEVGDEIYRALEETGEIIAVSGDVAFRRKDYDYLVEAVKQHFVNEPTLTVVQFRDRFNTSRKYALAFLEHLDSIGITVREGDLRKLRK